MKHNRRIKVALDDPVKRAKGPPMKTGYCTMGGNLRRKESSKFQMNRATVALGLTLAGAGFGQPVRPAAKPASVEGTVVNRATKEPLRKVAVRLSQGNLIYETTTDPGGVFRLAQVPPGSYRVSAEKAGFVRSGAGSRSPGSLALAGGEKLTGLVIELTPQAVVTGRVTDEDGDAMQSATVQLWRMGYRSGRRQLTSVQGMGTNDLGEFRIAGIAPGKYYLSASKPDRSWNPSGGGRAHTASAETGYVTHYWPAALEAASASPLELGAGQVMSGMEMRLTRVPVSRIRGHVVGINSQGTERSGVVVFLDAGQGRSRPTQVNPRDGSFEIRGARPGSYTLIAVQSRRGMQMTGKREVTLGEGLLEGVDVQLQPSFAITGKLAAEPAALAELRGVAIQLTPLSTWASAGSAQLKEDGTFATAQVIGPDRYRVSVQGLPEGYWLKSARYGEREVYENELDLTAGSGNLPLQIEVAPGAGAVEGVVKNEKSEPGAGAVVTLSPDQLTRQRSEMFKQATTDQNGAFRFAGLSPGRYRLLAWQELEPGAYQDPEFLGKFEAEAQRVEVRLNGRETVELKQISSESVSAR